MTYATQAHLDAAFGTDEILQLTDRNRDGVPDTATLDAVLARADSLIDGYLAGRYALPLAPPYPPVIVATACDVARYWLYDNAAPDQVRKLYEDALAWLKDVAMGKFILALPPPMAATALGGSPSARAPERVFSDATLTGF